MTPLGDDGGRALRLVAQPCLVLDAGRMVISALADLDRRAANTTQLVYEASSKIRRTSWRA